MTAATAPLDPEFFRVLAGTLDSGGVAVLAGTVDTLVAQSSNDGDSVLALIAGFFIGLYLVYDGFGKWKTKRLIQDTPTEKVRSMAVGRTELEGVARNDGRTIEAPFTDEECLHVDWEIEEWRKDPDDDDYEWQTIASGEQSVPFQLDDGTGEVHVRAREGDATFEISGENQTRFTTGESESPPREVREFIERHDRDDDGTSVFGDPIDGLTDLFDSDVIGHSNRRRRYTQRVLPDESEVYVLGSAVPRGDGGGTAGGQADLLEMTRDELDTLLVSDRSEEGLTSYYGRRGPLEIVGGIALSAVCLAFLLLSF